LASLGKGFGSFDFFSVSLSQSWCRTISSTFLDKEKSTRKFYQLLFLIGIVIGGAVE
jgi:hypothetical protein